MSEDKFIPKQEKCPDCKGSGFLKGGACLCSLCGGTGMVQNLEKELEWFLNSKRRS
jgi:DnaJ-class molecular chaperone